MNDRAQSIGIGRLILGTGVGVVVFWIVSEITAPLFEYSSENSAAGDTVAQNGNAWLQEAVNFMPGIVLFIGFFGIIAYAVFSRQVGA